MERIRKDLQITLRLAVHPADRDVRVVAVGLRARPGEVDPGRVRPRAQVDLAQAGLAPVVRCRDLVSELVRQLLENQVEG